MRKKPVTIVQKILSAFGFEKRSNATTYSGASGTRLTLDWIATILSSDQEIRGNLRLLRARGRELSRNNPVAQNFLKLLAANVQRGYQDVFRQHTREPSAIELRHSGGSAHVSLIVRQGDRLDLLVRQALLN